MAGRELLLALYTAFYLINGVVCQDIVEQPLNCYRSSATCTNDVTQLTYSECCATSAESFVINGTCYACAELLSFTATSYTVDEGAGYARIGVQLLVNPQTNIFVFNLILENTDPPSALAGIDYGPFPDSGVGLIHIVLEGEELESAGFVVFDDDIVEYNERLQVRLQPLSMNYVPLGTPSPPANVTIIDNDQVIIALHPPGPVSVVEGREPSVLSFLLNKTGVAVRSVSVEIILSDTELVFSGGEGRQVVTFEPNDVEKEIQIEILDDNIVEETENQSVILRVPEGETGVNLPQDSVIIRVEDNDFVIVDVTLPLGQLRVPEANGSFEIRLFKMGMNERPVRVRVVTEAGSAQSGVDFSPVDMVIELLPEIEVVPITVNLVADGVVEGEESFKLRVQVPANERAVQLGVNCTRITVVDSDVLTVSVDVTSLEVTEGGDQVFLNIVTLKGALDRDVTISLNLNSGDVSVSESTVMLSPGNVNVSVAISAIDDELFEGEESVELMITSSDSAVVFSMSPLAVDITIEDNDSPQLSFSEAVYQFNESSSMGEVMGEIIVNFRAQTERAHTWTLTSVPSTATEGKDYSAINAVLVFDNVTRERRVSFVIFDDDLSEGLEVFELQLIDNEGEVVNSSVVQIVDDEKLLVSFVGTEFTVSEGEQLFYLEVNKSGITTFDIAITINFTDISAVGGTDYGFFPTSEFLALTLILADETGVFYPIPIIDDDIIENVESINAQLLIRNGDGTIVIGDISRAVISIEDNDKLRVFLTQKDGGTIIPEANTTLEFIVSRDENASLNRDITVTLTTVNATATAGSRDYISTMRTFTFTPDGPLSFGASVNVLDDQTVENTESFIVRLTAPIDGSAVELPENDTIIYITDNDKIQVDFSSSTYTFSEGLGVATVLLDKEGNNEIPVKVSVVTRTVADTAEAGRDFNATIQPVEFLMTEFQIPLNISLVDDDILENTETFTVILNEAGDDSNVVLGPQSSTSVIILDDDSVTVGFEEMEYGGSEGDDVIVRVVLSAVAERDVEVGVATSEGTATANDFSLTTSTVTIPSGAMSMTLLVSLVQDTMCEDFEETFSLHLLSNDRNVVVGMPYSEITIREDDICGIEFMNETVVEIMEPENGSMPLTLCVGLTGDFMFESDVQFVVVAEELRSEAVDEQALRDIDFSLEPTVLTFQSSDRMICFDIFILTDDRPEGPKRFNVSIATQQGLGTGRATEITVVINDQEDTPTPPMQSVVEFSAASYTVRESDGVLELELEVSPPIQPNEPLPSVIITFTDGSAVSPQDYIPSDDMVTIGEGSVTRVAVVIVMDGVTEGTESFSVQLSLLPDPLVPVSLGGITMATVTIIDTGDVFVNDSVVGDPLFVVPLSLTPDSHAFEETPSLCYEIHGASGTTFNFVSDTCTSVNALYQTSTVDEELNFISEIGVKAVDINNDCVTIRVPISNNCFPEIRRGDEDITSTPRFDGAGISVRRSGSAVRVSVPNCASSQLVMWIKCRNISSQPQLRFDITRGFNLNPTSHGLLGQFWNIPVRVTRFHFTGEVTYDLQEQELYLVEIQPEGSSTVRRFVAEFYPVSWDRKRPEPCLYAGDQQGGRIREIKSWNDPVIENNYRLYRTSDLFETDFRFSMFQSNLCSGG